MDVILDVQGFKKYDNVFVPKELVAVTVQRKPGSDDSSLQKIWSYVFSPPHDWKALPEKYRTMNYYLTRNFHGLPWDIGDTPYENVKEVLDEIIKDKCYIYVKGAEKKKWLKDIIGNTKPIIDLEKFKCPSIKKLKNTGNCDIHNKYSDITEYKVVL